MEKSQQKLFVSATQNYAMRPVKILKGLVKDARWTKPLTR